jgi:hypothetical protein
MTDNADSAGRAAGGSPAGEPQGGGHETIPGGPAEAGGPDAAPGLAAGDRRRALTVYAPDPEGPEEPDDAGGEAPGDPGSAARGIALAAERDRLARALRETHRQLATAQSELMAVSHSATMELGKALTQAAKRPWIGGPKLPGHLYRLWRERRAVRAARGVAEDGFRSAEEESWASILLDPGTGAAGDRFLAAYTVPGLAWPASGRPGGQDAAGRLVIAGVLTDQSCATLAPDATAEQLLPHDAAYVLEGSGADFMLIEAAALLPGGAWAHAGDPAAADRGRRLSDLIDLARALGKPVIFLRNAPLYLMPYLDWLGGYCDAVADGGLGLQLARFNPVDLPGVRAGGPVYAGTRHPREAPAVRRLLDELTGGEPAGDGRDPAGLVRVIGEPSWRAAPGLYREYGLFVAATAAQARAQLACGARVVGPVGGTEQVSGAAVATSAAQAARHIAAAASAGPRSMAEITELLHELFEKHATPVRLAELARRAGLPARPAPGRRVAVLAGVRDAASAGRLADSVLGQRLRPQEVVVWLDGDDTPAAGAGGAAEAAGAARQAITGALGKLAGEGVTARVASGTGLAAAARAAQSPWSAPWDPQVAYPASYLLGLMCALECSRADAVGHVPGADYVFTGTLAPAAARTDLYRDGVPPHAWARRGLRLFAVSPAGTRAGQ